MSREAGIPAMYPGDCPRCPEPIEPGDRIIVRAGTAYHVRCHSGQDDDQ